MENPLSHDLGIIGRAAEAGVFFEAEHDIHVLERRARLALHQVVDMGYDDHLSGPGVDVGRQDTGV